jgi:hypothetical protein
MSEQNMALNKKRREDQKRLEEQQKEGLQQILKSLEAIKNTTSESSNPGSFLDDLASKVIDKIADKLVINIPSSPAETKKIKEKEPSFIPSINTEDMKIVNKETKSKTVDSSGLFDDIPDIPLE